MITIFDILYHLEPALKDDVSVPAEVFERHGLPFMGGCQGCHAQIAAYNAHPGLNGYLYGSCCAEPDLVFPSVEEFLKTRQ